MDFLFSTKITPEIEKENIVLFNQDCLNVLSCITNNSIDLVVTDPPYKISQGGGGITKDGKKYCGGIIRSCE